MAAAELEAFSEVLVQLIFRDVFRVLLSSNVHAGRKLLEDLVDALFDIASYAVVNLLPSSLDDEVNKVWVGSNLSLLASICSVLVSFGSHQRFRIVVVQVP